MQNSCFKLVVDSSNIRKTRKYFITSNTNINNMLKINIFFVYLAIIILFSQPIFAFSEEKQEEKTANSESAKKPVEFGVSGSYLSSKFARSNGDIASAIDTLEPVYNSDNKNVEIANQLMGLYLMNGQINEAMGIASDISSTNAKEPMSALMLSLREIKKHDYKAASDILGTVSEEEGGQLWLPLISAWLDAEQKKLVKPLKMEELSAEVGKAAPIVSYHLALINARAGFSKEAAENFKAAVSNTNRPATRVMQMLLHFYSKTNSPILKPVVEKYADKKEEYLRVKIPFIENANDGTAEIMLTMGSIMLAADITQDAALYLQLALYMKPDMDIARLALSQAYSELQQYGIANQLLLKIPHSSPLYNDAQLNLAINFGRLQNIDSAIAKLNEIIAKSPKNIEAYIAKGDLLRSQERYTDAINVYQSALQTQEKIGEQHWPVFFAIGTCFDKQGNWAMAEKNLRMSLELSPEQPDVLNYLGYSFLIRGENLLQAKEFIEKAVKKRPSDPQILDSMGWVLYMLKDYQKAAEYLEIAVSLLPADTTVNDHLGDVYWRLGRKTEARFQWDRAITYSKDEKATVEIQRKLKDGLPTDNIINDAGKKDNTPEIKAVVTQ